MNATLQRRLHPVVYWLTQPRMSLGFDQDVTHVEKLLAHLSPRDFLVIDEATEQRCPSVLHDSRYRTRFFTNTGNTEADGPGWAPTRLRVFIQGHCENPSENAQERFGSLLGPV